MTENAGKTAWAAQSSGNRPEQIMTKTESKSYRQINVVLRNAKLEANSDHKRTQKFLVFSDMEAIQKRHELQRSNQWSKYSAVSFENPTTGEPITI